MVWERIANIGKVVAVVTGVIGIWTFVKKSYDESQARQAQIEVQQESLELARQAEAREWAKVAVVEILEDEGARTFENLHDAFLEAGLPEAGIAREELSDGFLRRILLDLYESGVIYIGRDGEFDLDRRVGEEASLETLTLQTNLLFQQNVRWYGSAFICANPDKLSVEDVATRVADVLQVDREQVRRLLMTDIDAGMLATDASGKFAWFPGCAAFPAQAQVPAN